MIYTATIVSDSKSAVTVHPAFVQRELKKMTQGRMSGLSILGKPLLPQLAYDGYRANISAFLFATATNRRTTTGGYSYPLPFSDDFDFPLAPPSVAFRLKSEMSDTNKKAMMEGWRKYGIKEIRASKKTTIFTLENPPFSLGPKLAAIGEAELSTPEGYCTLAGFLHAAKLYNIVDLFCRTNTYPAFRELADEDEMEVDVPPNERFLTHNSKRVLVSGEDADDSSKRRRGAKVLKLQHVRGTTEEPEEPTLAYFSDVLVAKPSPMPSSTCYGPPTSVPNLPGHCFPYFSGLLASDPVYVRTMVCEHFFSLLPNNPTTNPREAYQQFKKSISPLVYTDEGKQLTHILKGIELALQTQTQVYFMFDRTSYLGFCLLGGYNHIYDGARWIAPLNAVALREEVSQLYTHDVRLGEIADLMNKCKLTDGSSPKFSARDLKTSVLLATELRRLDLNGSGDAVNKIDEQLRHLNFGDRFLEVTDRNLIAQIPKIFAKEPLFPPSDAPMFIPAGQLELLADVRMFHLFAFGPTPPSFFSATGVEYTIPSKKDKDNAFPAKVPEGFNGMNSLIVSLKLPAMAVKDVGLVMERRAVKFDTRERAKGSRCIVYKEKAGKLIWEALKETVGEFEITQKGKGKGKGKDVEKVDLEHVDLSGFFD